MAGGWQPIETAPRDGTPILSFDGTDMAVIEWAYGAWRVAVDEYGVNQIEATPPTHWQPLPTPPSSPATGGEG